MRPDQLEQSRVTNAGVEHLSMTAEQTMIDSSQIKNSARTGANFYKVKSNQGSNGNGSKTIKVNKYVVEDSPPRINDNLSVNNDTLPSVHNKRGSGF